MAVIKITNKQAIDELQAKLILRLGRKISQQETLDLCVQFANEHIEDILVRASSVPMLTPEKAEEIISRNEEYKDTYYNEQESFSRSDDDEIYNL
ncbi:MAG TPA: hypothetical protein VKK79_17640 [Candidatus Lokiarchaeia archaeon]|nr:hypothetical protein [Candidatus Lokiarchaeia archaeon]